MAGQYNPYRSGPSAEAGDFSYGYTEQLQQDSSNRYGNSELDSHELQPLPASISSLSSRSRSPSPDRSPYSQCLSQPAFLAHVTEITALLSSLAADMDRVTSLQQQLLNTDLPPPSTSTSTPASSPTPPSYDHASASASLDRALDEAHARMGDIRQRILELEHDRAHTSVADPSHAVKVTQVERLKSDFRARMQAFRDREAGHRAAYREQTERQFRIVRPDATPDEVREAVDSDWSASGGVFQTAILQSQQRRNQARAVLGAVQTRHDDLRRIERTMAELASIMTDLDRVIEQQGEQVRYVEEGTEKVQYDLQRTNEELVKTKTIMESIRRHKWMCLGISVAILVVIIIIIVLAVVLSQQAASAARQATVI